MKCDKCGFINNPSNHNCLNCGSIFTNNSHGLGHSKIIIIVVLVIAGAIAAGIFLFKKSPNDSNKVFGILGDVNYEDISYKLYSYKSKDNNLKVLDNYLINYNGILSNDDGIILDTKGNELYNGKFKSALLFKGVDDNLYYFAEDEYFKSGDGLLYKLNNNEFEKVLSPSIKYAPYGLLLYANEKYDYYMYHTKDYYHSNSGKTLYGIYEQGEKNTIFHYINNNQFQTTKTYGFVKKYGNDYNPGYIIMYKTHILGETVTSTPDKYGLYDLYNNKMIIDFIYDDITSIKKDYYIVKSKGKFGLINKNNEKVLPIEFDNIELSEHCDYIFVTKDGKATIYDLNLTKLRSFDIDNYHISSSVSIEKLGNNYIVYGSLNKYKNNELLIIKEDNSVIRLNTESLVIENNLLLVYDYDTHVLSAYDENINKKYTIDLTNDKGNGYVYINKTIIGGRDGNSYDINTGEKLEQNPTYVEAYGDGIKILHENFQAYLYINNKKESIIENDLYHGDFYVEKIGNNYYIYCGSGKMAYFNLIEIQ